MSEFFHYLSMQALDEMDDRVKLKFDAINELNKNIIITETNKFKTLPKEIQVGNFADYKTENQNFEDDVVKNILYEFKVEYSHDTDHLNFPNTADEIKKEAADDFEQKNKLDFALKERDQEIQEGILLTQKKLN